MMNREQNELLTRVGAGTSGGALMREYWQPVMLADELEDQRPIKAFRVLGQDFVMFKDDNGRYGMLDRDCPHRGADLAFGRVENGGVRCAFHGWLFDADGKCRETPGEPPESRICAGIRQRAYPVRERSGILFAYLGEGEPPAFPALDCFVASEPYTFAFKGYLDCNWLQALEVGIDPAHASFLHRFFKDEDLSESYGKQFRGASASSDLPMTKVLREYAQPEIRVENADYGLQITSLRHIDDKATHVRVTNLLFPHAFVIPLSSTITITQWHLPIDDYSCYWIAIFTSFKEPLNKETMRAQRLELYELPDYMPRRNRTNNYGFDANEQATETYTGMGHDINVHDAWAVESQGRIQDRTREHLGKTDVAIIKYRRMLIEAMKQVEAGKAPIMRLDDNVALSVTGPATIDMIAPAIDWQDHWVNSVEELRQSAPWRAAAE